MPIVDARPMLRAAQLGGYAIPAFNVFNLEFVQAVVAGAEAERAPVVIQVSPRTVAYAGLPAIAGIVAAIAGPSPVPIALHLDHGPSLAMCEAALNHGFTSVMFDGASLPFAENVARTREVVALAHGRGANAEAELGTVGHASHGDRGGSRTDPDQAAQFVAATGIDALAAAIGTIHGMAETGVAIDLPLIAKLRARVPVALVMHGSSGVDDATLKAGIAAGITKVNLSTALQHAFLDAVRASVVEPEHLTDARAVLGDARDAVETAVRHRISVAGASGKAS